MSIKLSLAHSLKLPLLSTTVLSHLPSDYRKSQKGSKYKSIVKAAHMPNQHIADISEFHCYFLFIGTIFVQ